MNFKTSRKLMWTGFIIGGIVGLIGIDKEPPVSVLIGMIIIFISIVQACLFYCCPYCKSSLLNVKGGVPKHCPECGKKLTEVE